jgi:hypothetical protein
VRIGDGESIVAEIWLVRSLSKREVAGDPLGVAFPQLAEGGLVGVMRLPSEWQHYRLGGRVAPGLYTLRYALQPADGNHLGLASTRDYLLLSRAADDTDAATIPSGDPLVALSKKAVAGAHAPVMALVPVPAGSPERSAFAPEPGQAAVALRVGDALLGLVVRGHAQPEGY